MRKYLFFSIIGIFLLGVISYFYNFSLIPTGLLFFKPILTLKFSDGEPIIGEIYIDNVYFGKVSSGVLDISNLEKGNHKIRIIADGIEYSSNFGYYGESITLTFNRKYLIKVFVKDKVTHENIPNARIYIDNKFVGETDIDGSLNIITEEEESYVIKVEYYNTLKTEKIFIKKGENLQKIIYIKREPKLKVENFDYYCNWNLNLGCFCKFSGTVFNNGNLVAKSAYVICNTESGKAGEVHIGDVYPMSAKAFTVTVDVSCFEKSETYYPISCDVYCLNCQKWKQSSEMCVFDPPFSCIGGEAYVDEATLKLKIGMQTALVNSADIIDIKINGYPATGCYPIPLTSHTNNIICTHNIPNLTLGSPFRGTITFQYIDKGGRRRIAGGIFSGVVQ